jgi:hypothetical protein
MQLGDLIAKANSATPWLSILRVAGEALLIGVRIPVLMNNWS